MSDEVIRRLTVLAEGPALPLEDRAAVRHVLAAFVRERASTTNGRSRIPPEAIAAVERVLAHRADAVAEVPGKERWRSTTVTHQCVKTLSHAEEAINGATVDRDTGEHPLAHAAARALLGLALALQRKDPP